LQYRMTYNGRYRPRCSLFAMS